MIPARPATQYLHQAHYGNMGGVHTLKPFFEMRNNGIYKSDYHPEGKSAVPLYNVRHDQVFATSAHPNGASQHALYEIRGDKMHTTSHHPEHNPAGPAFILKPHL